VYKYFNSKIEGDIQPQAVAVMNDDGVAVAVPADDSVSRAKELLTLHHSMPNGSGLNFELTKELALECVDEILAHWLPDGEERGRQYVACNPTRNDSEVGSFTINIDRGIWSDFATEGEKGGDLISLIAYIEGGISQTNAAAKILEFIAGLKSDYEASVVKRIIERKPPPKPELTVLMPIPADARERPDFFGPTLGSPVTTWEYRNAAGQVMFYVLRFNTMAGKEFRQLTYRKDSSGNCSWQLKAPPAPRPAYGLDRLAARPDAPALFAEGEKAADAAQRLFPQYVAVTTMNGSQSPEKTDFSPFAGRQVYIAPDNDQAGIAYKDKLIKLLQAAGAQVVAVMCLEALAKNDSALEKGYDLADAESDGWTADEMAKLGAVLWELLPPVDPIAAVTTPTPAKKSSRAELSKKKMPLELAIEFAVGNHGGNVASFNNQILAYSEGYWPALNPDVDIKRPVLAAIGDAATAAKVNGVYELIKIQYASKPEMFERNSPLICLNNGTLNPLTGELLPHSVEHFLTNKLDIAFDGQAQCPIWLQTLDEIFAPDLDKAEKIQLLQEYIGFCLIPDTRFHRFLWLIGAGGNGKSLILAVITALIGKINISYAQMERLENQFVRAELQGKLVNISSEMSAQATVADGYLKQITAGDIIEAERKNERPFSFKPYARLIGATNVLPRLLDHTDAFFRRAMIVRFNRQFKAEEQDKQREANLMAELAGILNWAVTGLQNLLQREDFVIPSSSQAEVSQYRVNSDPVRQFAEDFLMPTEDKNRWVPSGTLYEHYKAWSMDNGYKSLASNQFADRLSGVGIKKVRDKTGRYWAAQYYDQSSPLTPPLPGLSPLAAKYGM
jgi:putative DNA primase/helicase